ncbi:glycosyltransferase family 2 protein [Vibrio vulnificus]|uniref:glycosyltransferase n=1 Tax=Vibrio vulnificus TaxID=672 RepID=UPI001CDB8BBF|nr:glycosyltransferase [Vibrio vulnificus]MCA4015307.1 glycosyltransferase family 2 protein [Vibrio vulnificus]
MIALVILNYRTYSDSYELIKSICSNGLCEEVTIFLVDNDTNEKELSKLKSKIKDFELEVVFLPQKSNLGFSRGMNIGIDKARGLGFDFIVCSNNDILITSNFSFKKMISPYNLDGNIAWIGPQIKNLNSEIQNPLYFSDPFGSEIKKKVISNIFLNPFFGRSIFILRGLFKKYVMSFFLKSQHDKLATDRAIKAGEVYSLHGSFFALTPAYFSHYKNMDANTFLYYEELILSKRLERVNLRAYLNANIEVIHKEDSSTNSLLGKGTLRKSIFILKENYRSLVYYFKSYI